MDVLGWPDFGDSGVFENLAREIEYIWPAVPVEASYVIMFSGGAKEHFILVNAKKQSEYTEEENKNVIVLDSEDDYDDMPDLESIDYSTTNEGSLSTCKFCDTGRNGKGLLREMIHMSKL